MRFTIANILLYLKQTISTYNKSRKKQIHIYIMAQAYQVGEEKENTMETFTQRLIIKKK